MNIIEEEKKNVEVVEKIIDKEIKKSEEDLKEAIRNGSKLSFEDRLRGEHFNINSKANNATQNIKRLKQSKSIPYFGRIDISNDGINEKIYIGRNGITSDGEKYVTDWRAPVSGIYYDSQIGPTSYVAFDKEYPVELLLKRQINIKNGKLIDALDSEIVSNDDLLKPYLEINADNKMKTIIASIQSEQNRIIRKPVNLNMIVQGVAGSGKTSVALHRISYLLYDEANKLSPESFLILGPNDYFLNYVSYVLPDLDTYSVEEETFLNFAKSYINEKITLKTENESNNEMTKKIQKFKTTLEYSELLEKFIQKYMSEDIIPIDFKINDEIIFSKEIVKQLLFSNSKEYPDYKRVAFILETRMKNNWEELYEEANAKYREQYKVMDFENPERKKIIEYSRTLYETIKNEGTKMIKKYVKDIQYSIKDIYMLFMDYLTEINCSLTDREKIELQKQTIMDFKKRKVGFEDLPALMYIKYRLSNNTLNFKQIIIDEAQDYGLFHFDILKKINPNATFTIYGDLAQAIYSYRSLDNWEELNEKVFNNNAEKQVLSKSYRTTIEITENANSILKKLELSPAIPVIRHGIDVNIAENTGKEHILEVIIQMLNKDYKTIAIICKDEQEVKNVHKELQLFNLDSKIILPTDTDYDGGLFVLTAAASKGLEFDGVILNDASEKKYNENSSVDMHLLYVACTRALHELVICSNGTLTEVLNNKKNKELIKKYN